jgi:hypothetical protein
MGNPNPFYRFKQAWNAGFYPDNQIVSDLLNEIHGVINANLSTWAQPGVTSIYQLKNTIQNQLNTYNAYPYFGNFEIVFTTAPDPPFVDYYIYIRDNSLYVIDNIQQLQITGQYVAATKLIATSTLLSFTPGAYSGSFAEPLINEEVKVSEALEIVNINGSAIFPITYSFNPISNVATSGLARGDNWFIDANGQPDRQPVPNLPYENRRTFELPQLDGDDAYIISIMERIIAAALAETDYALGPQTEYNKYIMPDGWTKSDNHPSWTTYERVQFDFVNSARRKFSLVGRLDGTWLWQRFVSDGYLNPPYNFLNAYSENTQLPYEPLQAGRWLYNDEAFDFEFVEFTSGCYVSPEFYAMPAKPGDQWQFNVVEGNLTGINSVDVGLFQQDGEFIQKIGEASRNCCMSILLPYITTDGEVPAYDDWDSFIDILVGPAPLQFFFSNATTNYTGTGAATEISGQLGIVAATLPAGTVTTYDKQDFIDAVVALTWPVGIEVNGEIVMVNGQERVQLNFCNYQSADYPSIQTKSIVDEVTFYSSYIQALCCAPEQLQANVIIPSVNAGCYRMGLYNAQETGGGTTCQLTFTYELVGGVNNYIDQINENYPLEYYVFALNDGSGYSQIHSIQIPNTTPPPGGLQLEDIIDFSNSIPGMVCTYDEGTDTLAWSWTVTVDCNISYTFRNVVMDVDNNVLDGLFATESQSCSCEVVDLNAYSLYSLSNIINIDASDCFSTMIEFWSDNNSMAQGYEYFDNWKQKVRIGLNGGGEKPIIEENLYRQSNGVHRRPQNKQDLSLDLHTDFFDLDTQLAMTDATRHPYLIWSGKPIFVKGDIEVATIQDFTTQSSFETLSQMKFQALLQGFQPKNSSCLNC